MTVEALRAKQNAAVIDFEMCTCLFRLPDNVTAAMVTKSAK
jgi:hypothetical protein